MELVLQRPQKAEISKKYSVLYVDDEPVNLRIFQHAFKRDYNVFTSASGFEALELLSREKIDLIITDQQMPKMSGVDLLSKIVPKYPGIIRMIMTGFSDIGAIIRAVNEFGLDKYLVKPWDRDQLKVEFDKALEKKEREDDKSQSSDDISDSVIQMNDSILPSQSDLQSLIEESFVMYDNYIDNKYAYWFGEVDHKVIVAFFNTDNNRSASIALKSFINLSLSEIIYKSSVTDPSEILNLLFSKIRSKFSDTKDLVEPLDISISILNPDSKQLVFAGLNQSVYYFDENQKLNMLNGNNQSFRIKEEGIPDVKLSVAENATDIYFISKNMVNQIIPSNNSLREGVSFLQYMRGMTGKKMSEQFEDIQNQLSGDKSKCMLGVRL